MKIELLNTGLLKEKCPECVIHDKKFVSALEKEMKDICSLSKVNVIMTTPERIQELNLEFRKKDEATDVLSFELDDEVGEVYLCPQFIIQYRGDFDEIVRSMIHGILHLSGHDHEDLFDERKEITEEMFKIQEKVMSNLMKTLE